MDAALTDFGLMQWRRVSWQLKIAVQNYLFGEH